LDHDGVLSRAEVAADSTALSEEIVEGTVVEATGSPCAPRFDSATLTEADAVEIRATFLCDKGFDRLVLEWPFLDRLSADHRHIAQVRMDGREIPFVATYGGAPFEISSAAPTSGRAGSFRSLLWTGIQHIWTGYDHLAFLVGLLLLGGRFRTLVGILTAFTVAHSITLSLAALGVVHVSPRLVEPAIALSIVYVAVENFFVKEPSKRWRLTFAFGLIHGFGFAGALAELDLPRSELPAALFAFNLGVEVGQVAVLAVVLPLVMRARKSAWFRQNGVRALSGALAAAGVVWFVMRVGAAIR
ncbi:MAG TPA: HupE/UreJ family protein, partial [Polyangiaceae bacterium]